MRLNQPLSKIALICFMFTATFSIQASDKPQHGHKGPPQEAFDACADKAQGDSCEVITPEQETLAGTCRTPPRLDSIVCVPDNHKRRDKE